MIVSAWRSARSTNAVLSARRRADIASISPRSHRRRSVATWSLRDRPVCRRLPASPTSAVSRFSMLRCTSSSAIDQAKRPARMSARISVRPRSIAARSSREITPFAASIRACASDPSMSASASRRSKPTDAWNRATRSDIGSANRPDQVPRAAWGSSAGAGAGGTAGRGSVIGGRSGRTLACALRDACRQSRSRAEGKCPPRCRDSGVTAGFSVAGTMLACGHADGFDYKA